MKVYSGAIIARKIVYVRAKQETSFIWTIIHLHLNNSSVIYSVKIRKYFEKKNQVNKINQWAQFYRMPRADNTKVGQIQDMCNAPLGVWRGHLSVL